MTFPGLNIHVGQSIFSSFHWELCQQATCMWHRCSLHFAGQSLCLLSVAANCPLMPTIQSSNWDHMRNNKIYTLCWGQKGLTVHYARISLWLCHNFYHLHSLASHIIHLSVCWSWCRYGSNPQLRCNTCMVIMYSSQGLAESLKTHQHTQAWLSTACQISPWGLVWQQSLHQIAERWIPVALWYSIKLMLVSDAFCLSTFQ